MNREIVITGDGSHSIGVPGRGLFYHSRHGAIRESFHVFIESGLKYALEKWSPQGRDIHILEMGFGTGLNALLTFVETKATTDRELRGPGVYYEAMELYPLEGQITCSLNYCQLLQPGYQPVFDLLHASEWNRETALSDRFTIHKKNVDWMSYMPERIFDLVYYDAFAPGDQPELWTRTVFDKLFSLLAPGALMLTYCSKTVVRRSLEEAGFLVEKLPGPPHKREMLRATRKNS